MGNLDLLLEIKSLELREHMINALLHAKSGHTGGSSSSLDIFNCLYNGNILRHNPHHPEWEDRDRLIAAGHKAPSLSAVLADLGYFGEKGLETYINTYRDFGSPFQGHLCSHTLPGVEVSTGSLGQIISVAAGMAYALKLDERPSKVYAVVGDGELQEGQNWEAFMSASKYSLANLCVIVDRNWLQIDGSTEQVMPLMPLMAKLRSFGMEVRTLKLHREGVLGVNYEQLIQELNYFKSGAYGKPLAIVADTVKAFALEGMEGKVSSHGVPPSQEAAEATIRKLRERKESLESKVEGSLHKVNWKLLHPEKKRAPITIDLAAKEFDKFEIGKKAGTRDAYGAVLQYLAGRKEDIFVLDADLAASTRGNWVDKVEGFDKNRHIQLGIAEQNMAGWAAGLSTTSPPDGRKRHVFASSFAVFVPGRCFDQIRNTVAYSNLDCNFIGSHGGILTGKDGGTHQAIEDIALARSIPGLRVFSPYDAVSGVKAIEAAMNYAGPTYIRLGRSPGEILYSRDNGLDIYKAHVLCSSWNDRASIMATGALVGNALKAKEILKANVRVYDFTCLKPLDEEAVKEASLIGPIVTVEDHSVIGGLGEAVSSLISEKFNPTRVVKIGVQDVFGETGNGDELLSHFKMTAEDIANKVSEILGSWL
ncbi:MAG: transketolase C-terminal domain-containing protein [Candidatus Woesearchaeota archaeon]